MLAWNGKSDSTVRIPVVDFMIFVLSKQDELRLLASLPWYRYLRTFLMARMYGNWSERFAMQLKFGKTGTISELQLRELGKRKQSALIHIQGTLWHYCEPLFDSTSGKHVINPFPLREPTLTPEQCRHMCQRTQLRPMFFVWAPQPPWP